MRYVKAVAVAVVAGALVVGLALWIPQVSDATVAILGAVVAVAAFGAAVYCGQTRREEEGTARSHYSLIEDRFKEGLGHLDRGRFRRALAFFNRAIESEPECADAYLGRGLVHHQLEQVQQAIADFDRAIELDPEHPYAHFQRGFVYHQLEHCDQAVADLTRAIEIRPDEWATMLRAAAYNQLSHPEVAQADYDRAFETAPPPSRDYIR